MTCLLAAVLLLFSAAPAAAAAPVVPFALQETAARARARSYAADLCKQLPPSCSEAKSLLDAYNAALAAATACDEGKCKLEQIAIQAKALAELDRRDGALPLPPGGRTGRPFLALSAISSSRLTNAATRLGSPYEAAIYGPDDRTEAQKAVEAFCLDAPASCREMRGLMTTSDELRARLNGCASSKCGLEQVDPIIESAKHALSEYLRLSNLSGVRTLSVFSVVNNVNNLGIAAYSPLADRAAADLEKGTSDLGAKLDRAEKDAAVPVADVDAAGRDLFERQRRAALAADRLAYHLGYDPNTGTQARREKVNAATVKLSGLRARALALRTARGLGEDRGGAGAVGGSSAGMRPAARDASTLVLSTPQRTIIDRRLIPNPTPGSGAAPPIASGNPSLMELLRNSRSSNPTVKADALRRLNRTYTVGDPALYAKSAYHQSDPSACAVASQAQVLDAHGLLPPGGAAAQEKALILAARNRGYMDSGGTAPAYAGSLLTEHGMLVVKQKSDNPAPLEAAIRRGNVVQVYVNADVLWNRNSAVTLSHAVLITGAEISKSDGKILGVYVNDSGTDPPGAGKFISWSHMKNSWQGMFAEVR